MNRACALSLLLLAACANEPVTVTAPEGGGKVSVKHGDRLVLPLPQGDWAMREPITRAVFQEAPPQDGLWRFTPVLSGSETLRFESAGRTVTYEVTVP
jgi:hypothetical protein